MSPLRPGRSSIVPFGGTDKLTSAYGIWQNGIGSTSYTIAGGSAADGAPAGLTHFEGITGSPTGYTVIGITGTSYAFGSIPRNLNGSFGSIEWTSPLSYPGASTTTGNTVIGNQAIGIYLLPSDSTVYAYVATVPEPATIMPPLAALGGGWYLLRRRGTRAG
ncbi:MAG: hypothetical protein WD072_00460 [Pirellulales bacterium]